MNGLISATHELAICSACDRVTFAGSTFAYFAAVCGQYCCACWRIALKSAPEPAAPPVMVESSTTESCDSCDSCERRLFVMPGPISRAMPARAHRTDRQASETTVRYPA